MSPNSNIEFVLIDQPNVSHEIIFVRSKNKTINIMEYLSGLSFTDSLIYQIYFKQIFRQVPTFSDLIANNRSRYNITLQYYNTTEDEINQIITEKKISHTSRC